MWKLTNIQTMVQRVSVIAATAVSRDQYYQSPKYYSMSWKCKLLSSAKLTRGILWRENVLARCVVAGVDATFTICCNGARQTPLSGPAWELIH